MIVSMVAPCGARSIAINSACLVPARCVGGFASGSAFACSRAAAIDLAVAKMIERGWLQEVDANLRKNEPLWRETGDGHGTTLGVTEAGLLAIGIEPMVVKTRVANCGVANTEPEVKHPTLRTGTKQALLISMLQRPQGVSMQEIVAATGWQAHYADVRIMPM